MTFFLQMHKMNISFALFAGRRIRRYGMELNKIFDLERWEQLQDSLADVTKMAILMVDYKGGSGYEAQRMPCVLPEDPPGSQTERLLSEV